MNETIVLIYITAISFLSFLFTAYDKYAGIKRYRYRISEIHLMMLALLDGSVAMFLTCIILRHKTHHRFFMVGLVLIIGLHTLMYYLFTH